MNGRELMLSFLGGKKGDRIPVCPIFDRDYMIKAAGMGARPWEEMGNKDRLAVIEGCYRRHPKVDFVFCPSGAGKLPRVDVPKLEDMQDVSRLRQFWGEPLTSEQVLASGIYDYMPSLLQTYGREVLLAFTINVPFAHALSMFGGYEDGLVAITQHRTEFINIYMELCRRTASFLKAGASLGFEAVWITQYYAGCDTISPKIYREIALPGEKFLFEAVRDAGLKAMYWFLGDLTPILPDILQVRPDAIVLEPGRKGYTVDIGEIRRIVGSGVGLCGFPDEQDMVNGSRENIAADIRGQVKAAGNGPLAMTTPILKADVDPATVDFFIDEVHKYST
jgi:uroporphyrinogen-III decarboxylase